MLLWSEIVPKDRAFEWPLRVGSWCLASATWTAVECQKRPICNLQYSDSFAARHLTWCLYMDLHCSSVRSLAHKNLSFNASSLMFRSGQSVGFSPEYGQFSERPKIWDLSCLVLDICIYATILLSCLENVITGSVNSKRRAHTNFSGRANSLLLAFYEQANVLRPAIWPSPSWIKSLLRYTDSCYSWWNTGS